MQEKNLTGHPEYPLDKLEGQEIKEIGISVELTPEQRAHQLINELLALPLQQKAEFIGLHGLEIVVGLGGPAATAVERALLFKGITYAADFGNGNVQDFIASAYSMIITRTQKEL